VHIQGPAVGRSGNRNRQRRYAVHMPVVMTSKFRRGRMTYGTAYVRKMTR
jgi:hypothetical protein